MYKALNTERQRDRLAFETLTVHKEGAVLFAEISAPPMSLLGPELVRDLVSHSTSHVRQQYEPTKNLP